MMYAQHNIPKTQCTAFIENKLRSQYIQQTAEEYLNILAVLYGSYIESGERSLFQYRHMTMHDAEEELHIRTILARSRRKRLYHNIQQEKQEQERLAVEELKRFASP